MKITEEMLKANLEDISKNVEGFKQGYASALTWVAGILKQEEPKEEVKTEEKK